MRNDLERVQTFDALVGRRSVAAPGWIPVPGEIPQLQVGDGEPDDGRLVQLRRDGGGQRQHLGQFVELEVFFSPADPRRVTALLLTHLQDAATPTVLTLPFAVARLS